MARHGTDSRRRLRKGSVERHSRGDAVVDKDAQMTKARQGLGHSGGVVATRVHGVMITDRLRCISRSRLRM